MKLVRSAFDYIYLTEIFHYISEYNEGAVAGYGNRIRAKSPAKWGVQIAGMIFQTGSKVYA